MAARLKSDAFPPAPPVALAQPEGGGDRNAIPLYAIPNCKVISRFLPDMPLRGSSMRSLGGYLNVLSIESVRAGSRHVPASPHGRSERARGHRNRGIAFRLGRLVKRSDSTGFGFGFARYENLEAWCAAAVEIELPRLSGVVRIRRAVASWTPGRS